MIAWHDWQQWPVAWARSGSRLFSQVGQNHRLVLGVNLVLVLFLAYNMAELSWRLVPAVEQAAQPVATPLVAASRPQQNLNVARAHLFGDYQDRPAANTQRVEAMPETRLKLVLRGIVSGDDSARSGAIIAAPTGTQLFYSLGADLPGGAVLKEVHTRHIVLLRNGQLETLRLPRDTLNEGPSGAADNTLMQDSAPGLPAMSLLEYRDTLLENPQQLADVVQARPYHRNGVSGYQINPGRDVALFSRLGLQPNDVITAVNGIGLDNPARGLSILQTLRQEGPVSVEVLRGGVTQTLTVDVNQ